MGPETFNVGDTVRRFQGGENAGIEEGETFIVSRVTDHDIYDQSNRGHMPRNLEVVTRAKVDGVFNVGDVVRRRAGRGTGSMSRRGEGEQFTVTRVANAEGDAEYVDVYENDEFHHARNIEHVPAADQMADWERELLNPPAETVVPRARLEGSHGFAIGDLVRRSGEYDLYSVSVHKRDDTPWVVAGLDSDEWPVDPAGYYHAPASVEMVTPFGEESTPVVPVLTPVAGGFNIGDIVSLDGRGQRFFRVLGDYAGTQNSAGPRLSLENVVEDGSPVGTGNTWEYIRRLTVYRAAEGTTQAAPALTVEDPNRKLGTTPGIGDHIAITDPRIAWIWEDLGKYADGKNWCREYDTLANGMGIPGRKQKFDGSVRVLDKRIYFSDIEADSRADAERIFKAQLLAALSE